MLRFLASGKTRNRMILPVRSRRIRSAKRQPRERHPIGPESPTAAVPAAAKLVPGGVQPDMKTPTLTTWMFSIQQELDRHLAGSAVDPSLMQRLASLRRDDATWSILGVFNVDGAIEHAFGSLDPILAKLIHDGTSFLFGVRYGRKIELEYEVTVPSGASDQTISNSSMQSLVAGNLKGSSLLPHPDLTRERASVRGVVKVAMDRYAAWLAEVARTGPIQGR